MVWRRKKSMAKNKVNFTTDKSSNFRLSFFRSAWENTRCFVSVKRAFLRNFLKLGKFFFYTERKNNLPYFNYPKLYILLCFVASKFPTYLAILLPHPLHLLHMSKPFFLIYTVKGRERIRWWPLRPFCQEEKRGTRNCWKSSQDISY